MSSQPPRQDRPGDRSILAALTLRDWATVGIVTAGAGVVGFLTLDPWTAALALVFAGLAVTVAAADARFLLVPDELSLALFAAGLAGTTLLPIIDPDPFGFTEPWWSPLLAGLEGAAVGAGVLAALRWLWFRLRGVEAIGLGDVKLAGALGVWLGPIALVYALLVASLTGLALVAAARRFGIGGFAARGTDQRLPFAALLAPSAYLVFMLAQI